MRLPRGLLSCAQTTCYPTWQMMAASSASCPCPDQVTSQNPHGSPDPSMTEMGLHGGSRVRGGQEGGPCCATGTGVLSSRGQPSPPLTRTELRPRGRLQVAGAGAGVGGSRQPPDPGEHASRCCGHGRGPRTRRNHRRAHLAPTALLPNCPGPGAGSRPEDASSRS